MKSFKFLSLALLIVFFHMDVNAQNVTKNVIVEHFTNTKCSICAGRNPGFYNALNKNSDVFHIAFHPSSPYSSCLFSMQNKSQNDARTNYYDVFGATPIFVINGEERSSNQVQSETVYNEFKNQTTPVNLEVSVAKSGVSEIEVAFEVKSMSNNTIGNVTYFIALVEDSVFYNAPNGEKLHQDVFRKSLTNTTSLPSFLIPSVEGNQYFHKDKFQIDSAWDKNRMYAIVILSDADKKVVQVAKSPLYNPNIVSSTNNEFNDDAAFSIYPNPVVTELVVKYSTNDLIEKVTILNCLGHEVAVNLPVKNFQSIDVSRLVSGIYYIHIATETSLYVQKFIKI